MRVKAHILCLAMLLVPITVWGQGRGNRTPARQNQQATCLDIANVQVITGEITAINLAYGMEYPTIEVNKTLIKVAPLWFFVQEDFELKTGDEVAVTAAPSCQTDGSYLYAIEIVLTASGDSITLRDAAGVPLWSGGGKGARSGARGGGQGACIDPASIQTVSGTVDQVTFGAGIQSPTLVLRTSDQLLTIKIGPERLLLESDFELKQGDTVTVRYAYAACTDQYVALSLTNAAGVTITLREDDGTPAW